MSVTSEQVVGRALRAAADQITLPPEARWVPQRVGGVSAMRIAAALAGAILIVAAGLAIGSFRESRMVPATQPNAFQAADDAAWAKIRSELPADVVVLRPTWIPAEFTGTVPTECPTPIAATFAAIRGYSLTYWSGERLVLRNPRPAAAGCAKLELKRSAYQISPQLTEVGLLNERGTTVQVRTGPRVFDVHDKPHQLIYLNWVEDGAQFELSSLDLEMPDLLRVLRSLEPMK